MGTLLRDVRYGWRALRKFPGFATMAILTLALGIGANVAIFSFVDELWLRSMPVPHPERLVRIFTSNPSSAGEIERGSSSYPDFLDVRNSATAFSGVAALERRGALYDDGTQNDLVTAAVVSDNFFDLLQPSPAYGRAFSESELKGAQGLPVMVSYPFWRRQLGGDASLAGKTIVVDRHPVTVTGILPRSFRGTEPMQVPDLWIPVSTWNQLVAGDEQRLARRGFRDFNLFGRLRDGVSVQQASLELANVGSALAKSYPDTNFNRKLTAKRESDTRGKSAAQTGLVLLGIAALVLLIACANVASLLSAQAEHRRKEIATRVALGASRSQIVRQLLGETLVLTAIATAAALVIGNVVLRALPILMPQTSVPSGVDAYLSVRGLVCAMAAALVSLFLLGLIPALQASQVAPASVLKNSDVSGNVRYSLRSVLVVLQVAVCVVMVVSAGLLVRSVVNALNSNPGFSARQNMLVMELVPADGTNNSKESQAFVQEFQRRLEALPGVTATSVAMRFPFGMSGSGATRKVFLPEMSGNDREGITINFDPVVDKFFSVLGTRILRGRAIEQRDLENDSRVMVVNQFMAKRLWPKGDAVGQRVRLDKIDSEPYEVVGIAENSKYNDFQEDPMPFLYVPMRTDDYGELALAIRTSVDPAAMATAVRRTLRELNRDVPILAMLTWYDQIEEALSDQRTITRLIVALGGLGLLLAAIGLYGLMSFLVARRTQEIGIRMALGAPRKNILRLFLGSSFRLTGAGVLIGIVGAVVATQVLRSLLFGVAPTDVTVFAVAIAVLLVAAFAATLLPALRAIRIDPMRALRNE